VILVDDGSKDKTVEIAWRNSWISDVQLQRHAEQLAQSPNGESLTKIFM
jgi:hypothetical protein